MTRIKKLIVSAIAVLALSTASLSVNSAAFAGGQATDMATVTAMDIDMGTATAIIVTSTAMATIVTITATVTAAAGG